MKTKAAVLALLLSVGLLAAKDRAWETGTLARAAYTTYTIERDGYRFTVDYERLPIGGIRLLPMPNVTVHGLIKFVLEKGVFYIQDEDGKEFKLTMTEKEWSGTVASMVRVREYAKRNGLSEETAIRYFREGGFAIAPDPAPVAVPPPAAPAKDSK